MVLFLSIRKCSNYYSSHDVTQLLNVPSSVHIAVHSPWSSLFILPWRHGYVSCLPVFLYANNLPRRHDLLRFEGNHEANTTQRLPIITDS